MKHRFLSLPMVVLSLVAAFMVSMLVRTLGDTTAANLLDDWGTGPHAPRWMHALEDHLTVKGNWRG